MSEDPLAGFHFGFECDGLEGISFREVSGLSTDINVVETQTMDKGTRKYTKQPGSYKWDDITIKRPLDDNLSLAKWAEMVMTGDIEGARKTGSIVLYDYKNTPVARWNFVRAWPKKYSGAQLSAKGNEVATEEIVIVHEGLDRVS
ncbi:MAG: phage tail protein [Herpetosiphonaceae bacterium]|nr:MAG: phage tail protein [Herpetosiphonaceae bacterium]